MSKIDNVEFEEDDSFNFDKESGTVHSGNSSDPNDSIDRHNVLLNHHGVVNNSNGNRMISWLIKKGLVNSSNTANKVLIGIIIFNIIITIVAILLIL